MMQAEEYLEKIPMWTREKHSLTDIRAFLHEMGDPDRKLSIIHVAGTNGKGSVCAFLTSLYRNAGFRTGTFISPHLVTVRERFLLNNEMVSPRKLQAAFETVLETVNIMKGKGYSHPSYFEFLFYMAMALFADETPELVILETGLGGRLDATNVVENPLACVITSISLDHIMYLGDTIEAVAGEKAGIIKRQVPVIYDDTVPEASEVICERAVQMASKAYPVGKGDFSILETKDQGLSIKAEGEAAQAFAAAGPLVLEIPFEAPYQAENAMLAVKTAAVLGQRERGFRLTEAQITEGIRTARWAGRMERAGENLYLDGAHNPGGIKAFIQAAASMAARQKKKAYLLFGAVSDKDYRAMARLLCEGISWTGIGVVHIDSSRSMDTEVLAEAFSQAYKGPVRAFETAGEALREMKKQAGDELLFCAGSLYLIGELKVQLKGMERREDT
ncbi:bifunctional folylpolyglutamate synthase/dihydrofolate synthase [Enterocloster sp.]|uniref:bifunctional folylpolyglutamate synthase/dihydrofolate synthase n=1 Tax=Enterocloster sp. TaxID=2719315 RepID=UPI003AB6BE94